eukprot:4024835-Amphidinium_carterae.1
MCRNQARPPAHFAWNSSGFSPYLGASRNLWILNHDLALRDAHVFSHSCQALHSLSTACWRKGCVCACVRARVCARVCVA